MGKLSFIAVKLRLQLQHFVIKVLMKIELTGESDDYDNQCSTVLTRRFFVICIQLLLLFSTC